jgi:hypothetical protein
MMGDNNVGSFLAGAGSRFIFAQCLMATAAFGQESPSVYMPGCEDSSQPTAARSLQALDGGVAYGGEVFLRVEGEAWIWKKGFQQQRFYAQPEKLTAPSHLPLEQIQRYRAGKVWAQKKHQILSLETPSRLWVEQLSASHSFETFEVTYDGRIVLIGTPKYLIEVYEPGTPEPISTVPYPEFKVPQQDRPLLSFYWERVVTGSFQEHLLIYVAGCGRLFIYDAIKGKLKEVDTPWPTVDPAKVRGMIEAEGMIALFDHPGPTCIQFLPAATGDAQVAYRIRRREGKVHYVNQNGRAQLNFGKTWLDPLRVANLDLENGKLAESQSYENLSLPIWVSAVYTPVALSAALPTFESTAPNRKKKP